ncbi:MAG: ABC transporter permease [Firmicutes bacterium]|nr:ABC transporter permease [Bacillota bacterium]
MQLRNYIIRRILAAIPVLIGVSMLTFFLSHVIPASPEILWAGGERARPEQIQRIRELYHLDKPVISQYGYYLRDLLTGDLGISPVSNRPVIEDIRDYAPATFELALLSMLLSVIIAIPLGILSAIRENSWIDHFTRVFSLAGVSMPIFWLGLGVQMIFYYRLGLIPAAGRLSVWLDPPTRITGMYLIDSILTGNWEVFWDALRHILAPALVLAYQSIALLTRLVRSSMLDVLSQDYIRTARGNGLSYRRTILVHALRNALIPTVTVLGLRFGYILAGAVLTETVFAWPGMGRFSVGALSSLDYPSIMAFAQLIALCIVVTNLIVDILYGVLEPRTRYS